MSRTKTRLERLEENQPFILEGEPDVKDYDDNWFDYIWDSVLFYMLHGFISPETGEVVPDAVSALPEDVEKRIERASKPVGKLYSLECLQEVYSTVTGENLERTEWTPDEE